MDMRDEVLSNVGSKDLDTSGYQVSDLEDIDLSWKKDQLDIDAVCRPGIYTTVSSSFFNDFVMGSVAENPNLIDEGQDKKNSPPPHSTTPVSEGST